MQFFLHICSKNDLWLYPRKFRQADKNAALWLSAAHLYLEGDLFHWFDHLFDKGDFFGTEIVFRV